MTPHPPPPPPQPRSLSLAAAVGSCPGSHVRPWMPVDRDIDVPIVGRRLDAPLKSPDRVPMFPR